MEGFQNPSCSPHKNRKEMPGTAAEGESQPESQFLRKHVAKSIINRALDRQLI
jgi:hypothetical protein